MRRRTAQRRFEGLGPGVDSEHEFAALALRAQHAGELRLGRVVGVVEIIAGVIVAVKPKIGGLIVSAWLVAIIINLLLARGYYDIALRDLGLALGALSLSLLSKECSCKAA